MRTALIVVLTSVPIPLLLTGVSVAAELTGHILDSERGVPLEGVLVRLEPTAREAKTDAKGRFTFSDLDAGAYLIHASRPGSSEQVMHVELGSEETLHIHMSLCTTIVEEVVVSAEALPTFPVARVEGGDLCASGEPGIVGSLRDLPGVEAVRRGPIGLDPVVRGLRETQIATLIDDGRKFPTCPGRMDSGLSHVDPAAVESVEVVKGPYALTLGSGTLSAISVKTEKPGRFSEPGLDGRLRLGTKSNSDVTNGNLTFRTGTRRSGYLLSLNSRRGNDYEAGDGVVVPADFSSEELRLTGEWDVGKNDTLSVTLGYQNQGRTDFPGKPMNAESFDASSYRIGYERRLTSGTFRGARTSLYMNLGDHLMNNDGKPTAEPDPNRTPSFPVLSEARSKSDNMGGRVVFEWTHAGVWSVTAGMDAYDIRYDAERRIHRRDTGILLFEGVITNDAEILDLGAFIQQTFYLGERAQWLWGLRLDRVIADSDEPSDFFLQNTSGDLRQEELNVSAGLSWNFQIDERWNLATSLGRAVRTASVLERYANRFPSTRFQIAAEFLGDPELAPEVIHQVDVCVRFESPRFAWFLDSFYRRMEDYITVLADPTLMKSLATAPDTVYRYINGDGARYVGLEAGSTIRFGSCLSARLQAEWLQADDEELGEPALGVPPLNGSVALRYSHHSERFYVEGKARFADRQDRVAEARYEKVTPGHTIYGLRAGLQLTERLSLLLIGKNLTDKYYVNHLNASDPFTGERIAEPGRTLAISGLWEF